MKKSSRDSDSVETTVRGQKIILTPAIINTLLGINTHKPPPPPREFTQGEIHRLLMPGEPVGPLNISVGSMNNINRVIFYIYSRCLINKGKNFSHITNQDYLNMASILSYETRDLGQWIYDEMVRFRFHSSKRTTIPFPQLVSYFLFLNNIWHLNPNEPVIQIPQFGEYQLNRMGIQLAHQDTSAQSQLKKKRKVAAKPTESQKAIPAEQEQTSPAGPPGPSSLPGYLAHVIDEMKKSNKDGFDSVASQVRVLMEPININIKQLFDLHATQTLRIERMEDMMRQHLHIPIPATVPSFQFPTD